MEVIDAASDDEQAIDRAVELLRGRCTAVLTGAGISTDSGIPGYRGVRAQPRANPMTIQTYLNDPDARRRYWVGAHLGYRAFTAARPNEGHRALVALEDAGAVSGVITQNVDGLHLAAGSRRVVELHGTMRRVLCLRCGQVFDRRDVATQLERLNPWITVPENIVLNPDGDVTPETSDGFVIPPCTVCDGPLKPDVVYFGEFVPADRFQLSESLMHASDALLVVGTSLTVNSGIRVIERARRRELPLVIVNFGPTRVDRWADVVIDGGTSVVLAQLVERLAS